MAHVVVEQTFDQPLTKELEEEAGDRMGDCLEIHGVTWRRTMRSKDRRRSICEFDAPDAERVRQAFLKAGFKPDRVWAVGELTEDDE